ncbi:hypothetical protein TM074_00615 [Candidatus Nanosynbacter sp. TM7-074]|uniref:Uncharacterized protein n=1 Tax=Candidatus Nanosynbacter sp. TM7-074 TaxID=3158573 RepID=A0AB39JBR8_9BACT
MNPELPQVSRNTEAQPHIFMGGDNGVESTTESPELISDTERRQSSTVERYNNIPVALPVDDTDDSAALLNDDKNTTSVNAGSTSVSSDDTPLVAADEDLIEKEWVDKVKKIIILTKDDPYERSRVITQLQIDYLKKRYNKTLGKDYNSGE